MNGRKKFINMMIPIALAAIIGFSLYKVITIRLEYKEAEDEYEGLARYVVQETVGPTADAADVPDRENGLEDREPEADFEETITYPQLQIDYDALRAINEDYRAWLCIPVLDVSYPLVVGEDNDHYLHYTFEGKYNPAGCTFIDYETCADFTDRNTFIYGHNMRNGTMFGCLKRFRQEEGLCASDPYFYIYTEDTVYQYEIFAYYTTEYTSDRYMLVNTQDEYDYYVESARSLSEYVPGHDFDFSERPAIVTLSTCSGQGGTTKRMVVHGVLVGAHKEADS